MRKNPRLSNEHPARNSFLLPALVAALSLMLGRQMAAQAFTTLYNFTGGNDGANPYGIPYGLALSGNTLFGAATSGGTAGNGALFAVNSGGAGFTNFYSFTALDASTDTTNGDGAEPNGVILSGNMLYGTTTYGGSTGNGTVFAVNTNGTGFTNLHSFTALDPNSGTNTDGAQPFAGLALSGATLYGTTTAGGNAGNGAVFSIKTNGAGFKNLHSFTALDAATGTTNGDGAQPYATVIASNNILYGSATYGGSAGNGTLFAVTTNGAGFTNLHNFTALDAATETTNNDGAYPNGLILSGKILYGTANSGGTGGTGTVFAIATNGVGFTNFHDFTATNDITGDNPDGAFPVVGLFLSGNTLYGTAPEGGSSGNGTLFALNTNGTGFTTLYSFTALDAATGTTNTDGANPQAGVIISGDALYGTAYNGGASGYGTVFSLSFAPSLTIMPSGANVILTWPTNLDGFSYAGFTLQSNTNLNPSSAWSAVSPPPVIINAQNTVTNSASGAQRFYRLSQ